jgi:hypothetical protein
MRLWFLRIKYEKLSRSDVEQLRVAPILFRAIPASECRMNLADDAIEQLVDKYYGADSNRTRGHYKGSLRRFLSEAKTGDLVAIRVNQDDLLYGEFAAGAVSEVRGHPKLKGRPVRWLKPEEVSTLLKNRLPKSVLKYRGTMCLWSDKIDLPEPAEIESEGLAPEASESAGLVVKFIRVGADAGAGGRLSRLFPGGYYHFIPIPKHNDPEFCRFTYGSGCDAIRDFSLLHLRCGDVLVFYAGFRSESGSDGKPLVSGGDCVGIFAYYVVNKAFLIDYDECGRDGKAGLAVEYSGLPRQARLLSGKFLLIPEFTRYASRDTLEEVLDDYEHYNPHIEANRSGRAILICGRKHPESRLLSKVEFLAPLKNGAYIIGSDAEKKWGLKHKADLTRCSLRKVNHAVSNEVFQRLKALP